ncbi:MAG: hypothetical protein ONB46_19255 [candidate division KSB1 bacterium]|nr:hypothetical protein [candidate division KSB1 bacterium]MDZ7368007.1 hypothetical protein [candidate division KSB1 bacterium]MDZ7405630.1 hypothetical protein [candidate division KSB1 bacterium]
MPKVRAKLPRVRAKKARAPNQNGGMKYSFKLEGEINISAYVAQRTVNGYLLRRVANLIGADEPILELRSEGAVWIVPVILTIPGSGHFGPLGQIVVDAQYGHIIEEESTSCEEIEKNAARLAPEKAR